MFITKCLSRFTKSLFIESLVLWVLSEIGNIISKMMMFNKTVAAPISPIDDDHICRKVDN